MLRPMLIALTSVAAPNSRWESSRRFCPTISNCSVSVTRQPSRPSSRQYGIDRKTRQGIDVVERGVKGHAIGDVPLGTHIELIPRRLFLGRFGSDRNIGRRPVELHHEQAVARGEAEPFICPPVEHGFEAVGFPRRQIGGADRQDEMRRRGGELRRQQTEGRELVVVVVKGGRHPSARLASIDGDIPSRKRSGFRFRSPGSPSIPRLSARGCAPGGRTPASRFRLLSTSLGVRTARETDAHAVWVSSTRQCTRAFGWISKPV